ncbi:ABC transporter ATP-binding protein [Thermodesulfobacteriota bacterium]
MLDVNDIDTFYGNFQALRNVTLKVDAGEVVTILGANGAGKSTLLKTISGLLRPSKGSIIYKGEPIDILRPDVIVKLGICQSPEGRMLFPEMPVYKNLEMGAYTIRKNRDRVEKSRKQIHELFPILKERRKQTAGTLSGGEQTMLTIARALMSDPKLLMLDEPSLGLAPIVVAAVMDSIYKIRQQGRAILLVEQNAAESLTIADRGYVLETGSIVIADTSVNLKQNEKVRQAYLGA